MKLPHRRKDGETNEQVRQRAIERALKFFGFASIDEYLADHRAKDKLKEQGAGPLAYRASGDLMTELIVDWLHLVAASTERINSPENNPEAHEMAAKDGLTPEEVAKLIRAQGRAAAGENLVTMMHQVRDLEHDETCDDPDCPVVHAAEHLERASKLPPVTREQYDAALAKIKAAAEALGGRMEGNHAEVPSNRQAEFVAKVREAVAGLPAETIEINRATGGVKLTTLNMEQDVEDDKTPDPID